MNVRTLEPATRCALRAELRPQRHDRNVRSLRVALATGC